MFTPSQLEQMPVELERLMNNMQMEIMQDVVRRIKINDAITRSADWQMYRLQQMGQSSEYIKQQVQQTLKLSNTEVDKLYQDAIKSGYTWDKSLYEAVGKEFIPFADNQQLQQLIGSVIQQTKGEFANITKTMGFAIEMGGKTVFTPLSEYLQRSLDNIATEVASGTFDYNSVLKRMVNEMTKSGIRTVDYASGYTNRIEVAARRALMTGVNQVTGHINEQNSDELGTDKFEVSWHAAARPSHQEWQGRVYTMQQLKDVCGLGTVAGLCGANCYHNYYPFVEGASERIYTDEQLDEMNAKENKPKSYNGKEYTTYEATQRQRQLETIMRKQRQDIKLLESNGAAPDDIINAKILYQTTSGQYVDFSKKMGLPQQRERVYMDGLGKVVSGKNAVVVKQRDITIHKSLGAATKNYDVRLPDGTISKLVEGTKITKVFTFAGKGTNKEIRVAKTLEKSYNVTASEWKKVRGDGYVIDEKSNSRHAELHWYETKDTGRVDMKVKRYFNEGKIPGRE